MIPANADEPAARVFYALVPPPALQQALSDIGRRLAERAHGRPVPAVNIHLTLAFIGAWPLARLPVLLAAGAALDAKMMRVVLDTQGGFRRAGVAWVGASAPPPPLMALATSLASLLTAAGITVEARAFHPHLTLARKCHGPYPHDSVGPFTWDADHVALMQSETRPEGPRYTMLASWMLQQ